MCTNVTLSQGTILILVLYLPYTTGLRTSSASVHPTDTEPVDASKVYLWSIFLWISFRLTRTTTMFSHLYDLDAFLWILF